MNLSEKYKFYAEVESGHTFKVMIDTLCSSMLRTSMTISKTGIAIRDMDPVQRILFDIFLETERFKYYKFEFGEDLHITFSLRHTQKLIKSIKKKDAIAMYIDHEQRTELVIIIKPINTNSTLTRSELISINITDADPKNIGLPCVEYKNDKGEVQKMYNEGIGIAHREIQKTKKIISMGKLLKITIQENRYISFESMSGIFKDCINFGDKQEKTLDGKIIPVYEADFNCDIMSFLPKIAGFERNVRLFPPSVKGYPLKIRTEIGVLGTLDIYVKDTKQMESEKQREDNCECTSESKTKKRSIKNKKVN